MPYRVILCGLLLLLLPRQTLQAKDEKWFELSSVHFVLFTDSSEAKGRRLLTDFENRVAVFSEAFDMVPQRQFPIEIFLFSNEPDYLEALPRAQGEDKVRKSAYLLRGPDRIFIVARDKSPDDIANDVGHALGHVLFERYVLWRPFWLTEGAAEYVRKTGRSPDTKGISGDDAFAAADLVTIVPSATYNDNDPADSFRTQSYRLVRILAGEQPEVLRQYLQRLRKESDTAPKIQIDAAAADAKLKSYVETPLKAPATAPAIRFAEADPGRLAVHRGDLLLATGRDTDAARWYNGDFRDARVARAILTRYSRTPIEAMRALDRTSREIPDSGLAQYHFGALEAQDKKDVLSQVAALERSIQLLPLMGRAYAELARVYQLSGQAAKGLPMIARALELEPEFADHFYEIRAEVQLALNRFDDGFHDINLAASLPHADRAALERYGLKVSAIRRKIETSRREVDARRLEEIRQDVTAEAARREPPPKPSAPPPAIPPGSVNYEIETRAPIEVVETVYPDYPEALRKTGVAGKVTLSVVVGPDGKVKTAAVATSQVPDMNAATVDAVKKWSFKPGNRNIRVIVSYSLQ